MKLGHVPNVKKQSSEFRIFLQVRQRRKDIHTMPTVFLRLSVCVSFSSNVKTFWLHSEIFWADTCPRKFLSATRNIVRMLDEENHAWIVRRMLERRLIKSCGQISMKCSGWTAQFGQESHEVKFCPTSSSVSGRIGDRLSCLRANSAWPSFRE